VLVEQLEAEVHVPAGILPHDPLAPRTDLFTPPAAGEGTLVRAERLEADAARQEAQARPMVAASPRAARGPGPGTASSAQPERGPSSATAEPVHVAIEAEEVGPAPARVSRPDDPLAAQHDLFETMGVPIDQFETPTETPTPELHRAAERAAHEYEARHALDAEPDPAPTESQGPAGRSGGSQLRR
jgi:hypothetical protein